MPPPSYPVAVNRFVATVQFSISGVPLTTGEFDLLSTFVRNPNRALSRDQLMALMHHREAGPFDRAIDVQVGRLRRKIERDPAEPELIKSVRGVGYLFAARVSPE